MLMYINVFANVLRPLCGKGLKFPKKKNFK